MNRLHLDIYADPLGDVYVEWLFPIELVMPKQILIVLPTYKYEMSYFFGMPVPFSSIAESIATEVHSVEIKRTKRKIKFEVTKGFKGVSSVVIDLAQVADLNGDLIRLRYVVRKLVTLDRIFFNFVLSIRKPFYGTAFTDIKVKANFSYDVKSYRVNTFLIDKDTGRIKYDTRLLKHHRIGDFIYAEGENIDLPDTHYLDLHVHGSRIPIMIDRRIFWIAIFMVGLFGIGGIIKAISALIH